MAAYFWVGGAGTWDNTTTTNWAISSGGAGGAGVPTSADTATFDSASNATAYAVTVAATAVCGDFAAAGPVSGNVSFTSSGLTVSGSLTFAVTGITWVSGSIVFAATTIGKTVTTNGVTIGSVNFNGIGGEWTLGGALSSGAFTLTAGSFISGNYAITFPNYISISSTTRSLNLGSSLVTVTLGGTSTIWNVTNTGTLTIIPGTSTIRCTASTGKVFSGGSGVAYYNIDQGGAGYLQIAGTAIFNDIQNSYVSTGATSIRIQGSPITLANFTATGAEGKVLTLISSAGATTKTLTKSKPGIVSVDYMSIQDITATGSVGTGASWYAGTHSVDQGNNTGWIFSGIPNLSTRLFNTGIFRSNNRISLDEVTKTTSSISKTAIYSNMFDEVTLSAGTTTGSAQFSGSNYLSAPNDVALNPGTGNFTIEFWTYLNSITGNASFWRGQNGGVDIFMNGTGKLALGQAQISTLITDSVNMTTGSWVHIAAVKNGSTITLYKNGVSVGSSGLAPNFVTDTINYIGNQGSFRINGYMTNLRVVIGSAVYTSAFTPPTNPLTAISGTQLLILEDSNANLLKDSSTNNFTITNNGTVTWSATSPTFVSSTALRVSTSGFYAGQFDEVTGMIVTNGLVAYYDAGLAASQPSDGIWHDISDFGNPVTASVSPPTYNSSGYFTFDRVNTQRFQLDALKLTSWTDPWTIETWMFTPTGATWSDGTNLSHFISVGVTDGSWGLIRGSVNNRTTAWIRYGAITTAANATLSRDVWNQVVARWDPVLGILSMYVNGQLVDSSASITPTGVPDTSLMCIGGANNTLTGSPGIFYEGNIAAVILYNRALSSAEVDVNFQALRNRFGI